jgi:hypothetical protein
VTETEGRQVNQGSVVGLERDPQIELEDAVRAREGPVSTAPRSREPSKLPLVIGAMTRVPCGTAPSFCGGATKT